MLRLVVECLRPGFPPRPRRSPGCSASPAAESRVEERLGRVLICRECGTEITSPDLGIEVAGSHRHTFFNPAGILYEIGCFCAAEGCLDMGQPSLEFSWFAGFGWRSSICRGCKMHLGWEFVSTADRVFWGLILNRLIEAQRPEAKA